MRTLYLVWLNLWALSGSQKGLSKLQRTCFKWCDSFQGRELYTQVLSGTWKEICFMLKLELKLFGTWSRVSLKRIVTRYLSVTSALKIFSTNHRNVGQMFMFRSYLHLNKTSRYIYNVTFKWKMKMIMFNCPTLLHSMEGLRVMSHVRSLFRSQYEFIIHKTSQYIMLKPTNLQSFRFDRYYMLYIIGLT